MRLSEQTWHDLDMDKVCGRIDTCVSLAGRRRLQEILEEPLTDRGAVLERDALIRHLDEDDALRESYRKALSAIGDEIKRPLGEILEELEKAAGVKSLVHLFCALLGLFSITMIFIRPATGLIIFLAVLALNIPLYFRTKNETGEFTACYSHIVKSIRAAGRMLTVRDSDEISYRQDMASSYKAVKHVASFGFLITRGKGLTGSLLDMVLDFLRMFFHLDLIRFSSMRKSVLHHKEGILKMYRALGDIDALSSVCDFRRSLPHWCVPELDTSSEKIGRPHLTIREMGHPLLKDPVYNDVEVNARSVLITGCNASGKSTFLRGVALCALLGQSISTAFASEYRASIFSVISSMSVRDDITSGESYYLAEIRSVKEIIDKCRRAEDPDEPFVLCFVDEVLKGTNTTERIAASSEILRSLAGDNDICFAATHDIELTRMLAEWYDNCHFEEEMKEEDTRFSYRLKEGPAVTRNAIRLLRIMGYDESLCSAAEEMAALYEKTGKWPDEASFVAKT